MHRRSKLGALLVTLAAMLLLGTSGGLAQTISGSKHDFSSTGPNATYKAAGNTLCNTCHIPHRASTTTLLWNHTLSSATYTWSDTTTGGTAMPTTFSGTTKHCLSCHDGTVAVGDVITGTKWSTTNMITGNAKVTGSSNSLSGNHPAGVPYPATGAVPGTTTYNGVVLGANVALADYVGSPTGVKIYTDSSSVKGIECGSCHNPHNTSNTKMLRVAASSICTSCHNK